MIICDNTGCQFYGAKSKCTLKKTHIGEDGRCRDFKKGIVYYLFLLPNKLGNSQFITMPELSDDIRYSIYYLMKCTPLQFAYDDIRGILIFKDSSTDKKLLSGNDIWELISDKLDSEAFRECCAEFEEHGLPKSTMTEKEKQAIKKAQETSKEYGWVSPSGEYTESPWGTHEEYAAKIVESNGWDDEYFVWTSMQENNTQGINFRDFLIHEKNYALIHDPQQLGYHVAEPARLTKKQKDFLYGYFLDMGLKMKAEKYIDD